MNQNIWDWFQEVYKYWQQVTANPITRTLVSILITLLVAYITIKVIDHILGKAVRKERISKNIARKIRTPIVSLVYILTLLAIINVLASIPALTYIITLMIALMIAVASWDILTNTIAYYIILFSRYLIPDSIVEIDLGKNIVKGRVREITLTNVIIDTPEGEVVKIPNRTIISRGVRVLPAHVKIKFTLTFKNITPMHMGKVEERIREIIRKHKHLFFGIEPELKLLSASPNSIVYELSLTIPTVSSGRRMEIASDAVKILIFELGEYDVSVNVKY